MEILVAVTLTVNVLFLVVLILGLGQPKSSQIETLKLIMAVALMVLNIAMHSFMAIVWAILVALYMFE